MIMDFEGVNPIINKNTYISESVDIVGEVKVEENANIWFGARLRGDVNEIVIGENTNVQENSVIHVDITSSCIIGKNVTIGHGAIIHGCNISDNVLVGMGSIILNNAKIGKNTIIGAGSLITQGKEFPEGVLILGNPAKVIRELTKVEIENIRGVKCDKVLQTLLENSLIREAGRLNKIGKPIIYKTTDEFLKLLNIEKLEDLPPIEEFEENID